MYKKNILSSVCCIILSFVLLTGCAGTPAADGNTDDGSGASASTGTTASAEDIPSETTDKTSASGKKIKFATFQTGDVEEDWLNVQLPKYLDETGIEVEHVYVNHQETITTYLTWSAAGTLPDAAMLSAQYLNALIEKGLILNLGQYIEDNGMHYDFDRYFHNLLSAYKYNDEIYALPSDMDLGLLWYNRDLFDAASLPYPDPSWTWEDLRSNALALTQGEGPEKTFGVDIGEYFLYLWQNGTDIISADKTRTLMNSPEAKETFAFLTGMVHGDGSAIPPGTQEPLFMNGKAGMALGSGPWYAHYVLGDVDFNWGVTAMPKGKVKATTCYGSTFAVFEASENKKEAVDFITWFLSDEQQLIRAEKFYWFPPSNTVLQMDEFLENNAIMGMSREQKELVMAETAFGKAPIIVNNQNEISQIINRELSLMWANEKSVDDALEQIAAEVNPLLQ